MSPDEEREAYRIVLERDMEHGGSGRTGIAFIRTAVPELNAKKQAYLNRIAELENALQAERNKPPVIKEVIRQVPVEVIREVKVPAETIATTPGWISGTAKTVTLNTSALPLPDDPDEPELEKPKLMSKFIAWAFGWLLLRKSK